MYRYNIILYKLLQYTYCLAGIVYSQLFYWRMMKMKHRQNKSVLLQETSKMVYQQVFMYDRIDPF
jgi:hypothetical protein